MKLSPESFGKLTTALGGGQVVDGNERRRSARVEVKTRVPLALIENGKTLNAIPTMVRDVSPRGINVIYPKCLTQGQQFVVQLVEDKKTVSLLCTVMHSHALSNGLHSIGAEFTCVLPTSRENRGPADQTALERIRNSVLD